MWVRPQLEFLAGLRHFVRAGGDPQQGMVRGAFYFSIVIMALKVHGDACTLHHVANRRRYKGYRHNLRPAYARMMIWQRIGGFRYAGTRSDTTVETKG
jgi:calcineurin-like phosphoesterase family protein